MSSIEISALHVSAAAQVTIESVPRYQLNHLVTPKADADVLGVSFFGRVAYAYGVRHHARI
jgi:hypothetical protein